MSPPRGADLCRQAIADAIDRQRANHVGADVVRDRALRRARAERAERHAAELAARRVGPPLVPPPPADPVAEPALPEPPRLRLIHGGAQRRTA